MAILHQAAPSVEQVMDLESLPDGNVSFLRTLFALQRATDRGMVVEEVRRVVKTGGTWAFVDVMPASMPTPSLDSMLG
jgi:ubiquinone/menaquinone biosynthesis C-methylase UbiE